MERDRVWERRCRESARAGGEVKRERECPQRGVLREVRRSGWVRRETARKCGVCARTRAHGRGGGGIERERGKERERDIRRDSNLA